jgi:hypothetical protein
MAAKTMAVRVQFTTGFSRYTGGPHEFAVEIESLRDVIKAMDLKLVTTAAQKLEHERLLLDQDVQNYIAGTQAASVP